MLHSQGLTIIFTRGSLLVKNCLHTKTEGKNCQQKSFFKKMFPQHWLSWKAFSFGICFRPLFAVFGKFCILDVSQYI